MDDIYTPPIGFPNMDKTEYGTVMNCLDSLIQYLNGDKETPDVFNNTKLTFDGRQLLRELLVVHLETRGDAQ